MDDCYEPPEPIFSNSIQSRARKKYVKLESSHVRPVPLDRTISIRQTDLLFSSSVSLIAVWRKIRLQGVSCVDSSDGRTTTKCSHGRGRAGGLANSVLLFVATAREESSVRSSFFYRVEKKMGGALDVTGPDLGPKTRQRGWALDLSGPFPFPFARSYPFSSLGLLAKNRGGTKEKKRDRPTIAPAACAATRGNII